MVIALLPLDVAACWQKEKKKDNESSLIPFLLYPVPQLQ